MTRSGKRRPPHTTSSDAAELQIARPSIAQDAADASCSNRSTTPWSSNLTPLAPSQQITPYSLLFALKVPLVLAGLVLLLLFGGVVGWRVVITHSTIHDDAVLAAQDAHLTSLSNFISLGLSSKVASLRRLSLVSSSEYSSSYFAAWAEMDDDTMQVRYINLSGWETVRVDRVSGQQAPAGTGRHSTVSWVQAEKLQDKSHRPYTVAALSLNESSVYVSGIDLNVEFGKVQIPFTPVYRIAAPAFNSEGSRSGFVIANMDARHLWNSYESTLPQVGHGLQWDVLDDKLLWLATSRDQSRGKLYRYGLPEAVNRTYSKLLLDRTAGVVDDSGAYCTSSDGIRHNHPIMRDGLSVAILLNPENFVANIPWLSMVTDSTLIILATVPEAEIWRQTHRQLLAFYLSMGLAFVAVCMVLLSAVIFWKGTKMREMQVKESRQFLASVSHDLRSPLHVMSNALLLLQSEELSARYEFRALHAATESMLSLLSNTVFVYRNGEDKQVPTQRRDLRQDLLALAEIYAFLANEKDLYLDVDVPESLPDIILINWIGLKEILVNLLSNAIKFTVTGGIEIKVTMSSLPTSSAVQLCVGVSDTGPGMDPNKFQASIAATSKMGLGLGICRRIACSMDSELTLVSVPGKGSTFTVTRLDCAVVAPCVPQCVWQRLATTCKRLHFVVLVGKEDHLRVLPKVNSLVDCLQRAGITVGTDILSEEETDGTLPLIPQGSVIWIGHEAFATPARLECVLKQLEKSASRAIILNLACGRLSVPSDLSMLVDARPRLPHTHMYPPWTPDRMALQLHDLLASVPDLVVAPTRFPEEAQASPYSGISVLVVDDMSVNRAVVKKMLLKAFKVEADEACGGMESVQKCRDSGGYGLILMDLHMPDMDGCLATAEIRRLEAEEMSKKVIRSWIVGLSASVLQEDEQACLKAGMDEYFCKPMSVVHYRKVLDDALRARRKASLSLSGAADSTANRRRHSSDALEENQ